MGFCQDDDGAMKFRSLPEFRYLPYPIGRWRDGKYSPGVAVGWRGDKFYGKVLGSTASIRAFFAPLFEFVSGELEAGQNVLIHCLAGAHRAGTAGIACLMHLGDFDRETATSVARAARPAINPIGDFPRLLAALETA